MASILGVRLEKINPNKRNYEWDEARIYIYDEFVGVVINGDKYDGEISEHCKDIGDNVYIHIFQWEYERELTHLAKEYSNNYEDIGLFENKFREKVNPKLQMILALEDYMLCEESFIEAQEKGYRYLIAINKDGYFNKVFTNEMFNMNVKKWMELGGINNKNYHIENGRSCLYPNLNFRLKEEFKLFKSIKDFIIE